MMGIRFRTAIILLLFWMGMNSQELPPMETYAPSNYGAQHQNWGISSTVDNRIYVANNNGLLEFDGERWQLYGMPNNSIVRSVNAIEDKIYTGCFMDFGFWEKNEIGKLNYTSLVQALNIELLQDEQFWNILSHEGYIIAQSNARIYLIDLINGISKIIEADTFISKMFKINGEVFFHQNDRGIFNIINGEARPFNEDQIFKDNRLINVFNINDSLIFLTDKKGFFRIVNGLVREYKIFEGFSLDNFNVYSARQLADQSLIIGTVSNGILHINPDGKLIRQLNKENGLLNNTVLSIYEDRNRNLWLGLDYGINCINLSSEFSIYKDADGSLGTVYASLMFENYLYIGTNQGLYYKNANSLDRFQLVQGSEGQVWTLRVLHDSLICGHNNGTFIVKNGRIVNTITNEIGTWDLKSTNASNIYLQGNYSGLNTIIYDNNNWEYGKKLENFNVSSRFYEIKDNLIFVNHEYKGLYKIELTNDYSITQVTPVESVAIGAGSSILSFSNNIIYASNNGVYTFNQSILDFEKDSYFSDLFSEYHSLTTLMTINGEDDKLWRFVDDNIAIISPGNISNEPQIQIIPISKSIKNNYVAGFQNMTKISDKKYLIGITDGYIVYDTDTKQSTNNNHEVSINSILVNQLNEEVRNLEIKQDVVLKNNHNNIEFYYSVPYIDKFNEVQYQYQLDGYSDEWSSWSGISSHKFENLGYGSYEFKVRAKVGGKVQTEIASYKFEIERPLLLSNTFIIIYGLALIMIIILTHRAYRGYYRRKHEKMLEVSQREMELKQLEQGQIIIKLENDKLNAQIEGKNRELAVSTMSLIKKNEFLSSLKKKLKEVKELSDINKVVKTIDNSINNTDDWNMFMEAFNNADKNFIDKVKSKHPELTANDLRLCAYLRLNLSSKEIAPLLNISFRSVEVKRYRLRKKMNLPHDANLASYILDL